MKRNYIKNKTEFSPVRQRFFLLDGLRGLAIVSMIIFHLCYDIFIIYGADPSWGSYPAVAAWERSICMLFILVSGACAALSKNGLRRGIIVNIAGLAVTLVTVTVVPEQAVWFGILNLLGCCMMLFHVIKPVLNKINPICGVFITFLLFALLFDVPNGYAGFFEIKLFELPDVLYSGDFLAFLGLPSQSFVSSDYFPLVPWMFLYGAGFFLWRLCERHELTRFFKKKIPLLGTAGKYSLWIYLAHQPIIIGILYTLRAF